MSSKGQSFPKRTLPWAKGPKPAKPNQLVVADEDAEAYREFLEARKKTKTPKEASLTGSSCILRTMLTMGRIQGPTY
jgi:hypothetical protein